MALSGVIPISRTAVSLMMQASEVSLTNSREKARPAAISISSVLNKSTLPRKICSG
jgi:hypothetical protein